MLNFIICEDNKEFRKSLVKTIDNYMMNYDIKYEVKEYSEYDNNFKKELTNPNGEKVFILDIETPKGSGIHMSRIIREEYEDITSNIIIITAYKKYKYEALESRLYILDFIEKTNTFNKNLKKALNVVLNKYHNLGAKLCYKYNSYFNVIDFKDIMYIEKEPDSKRSIIHTTYGEEIIPKTLSQVTKLIDKRFYRTHRSLIININHVRRIDQHNNKIIFKNNESSYLIARNKKKGLIEYVKSNN